MKRKLKSLLALALCAVGLSAFAKKPDAVQLWEGGPFFTTCNVGAEKPQDYGYYFWWGDTVGYTNNGLSGTSAKWVSVDGKGTTIKFSNESPANTIFRKDKNVLAGYLDANGNLKSDYDAARAHLGAPWRMMTKEELDKLVNEDYCQRQWVTTYNGVSVSGFVVKGKSGTAYENNEVFFPAAGSGSNNKLSYFGESGSYWSSTPSKDDYLVSSWGIDIFAPQNKFAKEEFLPRINGCSVRAVKDPPSVKNVRTATHWPWDGKIDITCDLTGTGTVQLVAALVTNGVKVCEATAANLTGETTFDLDAVCEVTNGVRLVWNAKQDCPAGFNSKDTKVKVTAAPVLPVTLPTPENGSYLVSNLTANAAIAPISGKYLLPYGAKVGIYIVPAAGYVVSGEKPNPYVIEKVSRDTVIDTSSLPITAELPKHMVTVMLKSQSGAPLGGTVYFNPDAGGSEDVWITNGEGMDELPEGSGKWTVSAEHCDEYPTPSESTIDTDGQLIELTVQRHVISVDVETVLDGQHYQGMCEFTGYLCDQGGGVWYGDSMSVFSSDGMAHFEQVEHGAYFKVECMGDGVFGERVFTPDELRQDAVTLELRSLD